MTALYRKRLTLPSLLLAMLIGGCDSPPPQPPPEQSSGVSNQYLEALQEAEAVKHDLEERNLQEQRIDALLGRPPADQR